MFSTVSVPRDVAAILSPDTFGQMTENAQMALQGAWISHTDTLKTNLEKVKVEAEQKIAELSSRNRNLTEDLTQSETDKVCTSVSGFIVELFIDTFRSRLLAGLLSWKVRWPV